LSDKLRERIEELSEYLRVIRLIALRQPDNEFCQQIVVKAEEALQESFNFEGRSDGSL
jgi:hypothetical protein